jgi:O-antigen ligase
MLQTARALALATLAVFPLFVWPGAQQPFVTPRLVLLGTVDAVLVVLLLLAGVERPRWRPALAWATAAFVAALAASSAFAPHVRLQAMAIALLPIAWAWLLTWTGLGARRVIDMLVASGTLLSMWALAQFAGFDPLQAAGWHPAVVYGPRMRMYAALGNPNFVGAVLAALLPLAVVVAGRQRQRVVSVLIVVLPVAALAATGSRGAWLGAAAGLGTLALAWRQPSRRVLVLAALLVGAAGVTVVQGSVRALETTVRGRLYIWSVAAPHTGDHPLFGYGPGAVAAQYPRWEAERLRRKLDEDARRYAAPQQHLHNDYLEALIDLGVPGAVAWLCVLTAAGAGSLRAGADSVHDIGGTSGAIAALAVVALVDFPFARPVELFVFWTLAACTAAIQDS